MREAKAGKIVETLSLADCKWSSLNAPNSIICWSFPPLEISLFPFSVHEGSKSWKNWRDTQLGRLRMVHFEYPKLNYLLTFSSFGYIPFPIFSSWGKQKLEKLERHSAQVTEFGVFKLDHSQPAKLSVSPIFISVQRWSTSHQSAPYPRIGLAMKWASVAFIKYDRRIYQIRPPRLIWTSKNMMQRLRDPQYLVPSKMSKKMCMRLRDRKI